MSKTLLMADLDSFLTEIGEAKTASAKKAESNTEAGGYKGPTTHPVKSVPDNTQPATEGSRSAENEADIEKTIPANVNSAPENTGSATAAQIGIGLTQSLTGEDSSTEDAYKSNKDDPGTTHPAKTDDSEKYGSYTSKGFNENYKTASVLANDIMAKISAQSITSNVPAPAAPAKAPVATKAAEAVKAAEAGYKLAAQVSQTNPEELAKQAAAKMVRETMQDAFLAADLTSNWLAGLQKKAESEVDEGETHEAPKKEESEPSEESGPPSGPPEASAPPGGGGGAPGGDMGAGGPEQLIMALLESGMTPDQLVQIIQSMDPAAMGGGAPPGGPGGDPMAAMGGGGGDPMAAMGGGGGDPMAAMGGAPPGMPPGAGGPPGMPPGMEVAASIKRASAAKSNLLKLAKAAASLYKKQVTEGTFSLKEPKTAEERRQRTEIQKSLRDMISKK